MNDWIIRHFVLTREERWLIAGIVLIALCGLGVLVYQNDASFPESGESSRTIETNH